jgi:hypothetical protein
VVAQNAVASEAEDDTLAEIEAMEEQTAVDTLP